jgi:hypothetical protein
VRARTLAGVALLVATLSSRANATPCSARNAESGAPARLTFGPGGLGSLPEACPATDSALQGFASLLIAVDDFYGWVDAGLAPRFRRTLGSDDWLDVWLPPLEYRFSANATIEAARLDIGAASVGYHRRFRLGTRLQVSPYARGLLPTDTAYDRATLYGFDHGFSAVAELEPWLEIVGGAVFPVWLTVNGGRVHAAYVPAFDAEVVLTPKRWFALAAGAGVRFRSGDDTGFESFDPRAALRAYPVGGLRIELAAAAPLWGHDRTDVLAGLNVGWIF